MVRYAVGMLIVVAVSLGCATRDASSSSPGGVQEAVDPASVQRVAPEIARAEVQAGRSLLVCAYDDAKYPKARLEGSIPFSELQSRLPTLPADQGIILYCA